MTESEILQRVQALGITRVLHFTTNRGLAGILASKVLQSRQHVAEDRLVELVRMNNCYYRKDRPWFGYVNLSLQGINTHLYGISSGQWHNGEDLWWCVLNFNPVILTHSGVVFTTTNNAYSMVCRAEGLAGLNAMYAPVVATARGPRRFTVDRSNRAASEPTDSQAEILYPVSVSTEYLNTIFVPRADLVDEVHSYLKATNHKDIDVKFDEAVFG